MQSIESSSLSSGSSGGTMIFLEIESESPYCSCDYVNEWLDKHAELLTRPPPPEPRTLCHVGQYTFGPPGIQLFYSQPIPLPYPHRDIQLPFILRAPHRVSPMSDPAVVRKAVKYNIAQTVHWTPTRPSQCIVPPALPTTPHLLH